MAELGLQPSEHPWAVKMGGYSLQQPPTRAAPRLFGRRADLLPSLQLHQQLLSLLPPQPFTKPLLPSMSCPGLFIKHLLCILRGVTFFSLIIKTALQGQYNSIYRRRNQESERFRICLRSHSVWQRLDSNPLQSNFSVEPPPPLRPLLSVSMVSKGLLLLLFFLILHQPSFPKPQLPKP